MGMAKLTMRHLSISSHHRHLFLTGNVCFDCLDGMHCAFVLFLLLPDCFHVVLLLLCALHSILRSEDRCSTTCIYM